MRAGHLFEISSGNRRAVITEEGATLARVIWEGVDLLTGVEPDGYSGDSAGGHILVPWPGRIAGGSYEYEGKRYQLPLNHQGTAIHGLGRWAAWQVNQHSADRLTLGCREFAQPGYPFPLEFEQTYTWLRDGLEVSFSATNIGDQTAPFGYGCHPYLSAGSPQVDDDILVVRANRYLEVNADLSPTGAMPSVEGTPFDFRQPRPVGAERIDSTLTDLERDADGWAVVELRSLTGGVTVRCRVDETIQFLQVYTGDHLPGAPRRGLAVEPYTCAPNAFNNGFGLAHLTPGGSLRARWALSATS